MSAERERVKDPLPIRPPHPHAQPTPAAALNAMAEQLARTEPTQQLTNGQRTKAALTASTGRPPGTYDQLLTTTPPITSPITCGAYVNTLRQIAGER